MQQMSYHVWVHKRVRFMISENKEMCSKSQKWIWGQPSA